MLSDKQQAFVAAYLETWNASEAARRAGYKTKANVQGSRMLANASIQAAIHEELEARCMSADEVLVRLAANARADISSFLSQRTEETDFGPVPVVEIDIEAARAAGVLSAAKTVKNGKYGLEVELTNFDSLKLLAQHHGLLKERVEVEGATELADAAHTLEQRLAALAERMRAADAAGGAE